MEDYFFASKRVVKNYPNKICNKIVDFIDTLRTSTLPKQLDEIFSKNFNFCITDSTKKIDLYRPIYVENFCYDYLEKCFSTKKVKELKL